MKVSSGQFAAAKPLNGLTINGIAAHADAILHAGDVVRLALAEPAVPKRVEPENEAVSIVYEDDDLFIVDKPAPLACQCSERKPVGTLENRLAWHYRDEPRFVFRPVNRLDRGTSGLMACAKHPHAFQLLQKQLHTPDYVREYLAVIEGTLEGERVIDAPIAKAPGATIRRCVDAAGQRSITHCMAIGHGCGRTLVRLRLETGRTHQIRVHMAYIGHPVVGDFLYGSELPELPARFALHSACIRLLQPLTDCVIERASALPDAITNLLKEEAR